MGNNMGRGYKKAAKIMKINGEYFKLKTPSKVIDIIKDYPHHILLDSDDFLRFNLRAKPLDLHFVLQPNKIYLLFELPQLPQINDNINININDNGINNINNINVNDVSNVVNVNKSPLRRVRSSGVHEMSTLTLTKSKELKKSLSTTLMKRSVSELTRNAKSTGSGELAGPTRVKVRLPKGQVKRIMEESSDDVEVAQRILRLFATLDGGGGGDETVVDGGERAESGVVVVEEDEEEDVVEVVDRHCFNVVHGMCGSIQRKYKKLSP